MNLVLQLLAVLGVVGGLLERCHNMPRGASMVLLLRAAGGELLLLFLCHKLLALLWEWPER